MAIQNCHNCDQIIGNLQEPFSYQGNVVCKACKVLLEDESQSIGAFDSNVETENSILPPSQVYADSEHKPADCFIQQTEQKKNYGGFGRVGYLIGMFALAAVSVIASIATQNEPDAAGVGPIVTIAFSFYIVVNRLKNIGMNGWWSLLILVPFVNLYIGVKCSICPEGYQDTKKLDTAGKVIAGIFIGLFILMIVVLVMTISQL